MPCEPCYFHELLECAFCQTDEPEKHNLAHGSSKSVVHGFVPVDEEELQNGSALSSRLVSKFEIRPADELYNNEDYLMGELRRIAPQCVANDMGDLFPNHIVTQEQRENLLESMNDYELNFKSRHSGDFTLDTNITSKMRLIEKLERDDLLDRPGDNEDEILVRSVEEDCGMSLIKYFYTEHTHDEEVAVENLKNFIQGICQIMDAGLFHFDMKDNNMTCKPVEGGGIRLMTIDWGFGHRLTRVTTLQQFALLVPAHFNFYLTFRYMYLSQHWKPPEFNMFWLLCWLMSYNSIDLKITEQILKSDFTFMKAVQMFRTNLTQIFRSAHGSNFEFDHRAARFVQWLHYFPDLVTPNMWMLVHTQFVKLYREGEVNFQVPDDSLPSIPNLTPGRHMADFLRDVGSFFFPEDARLMQNVIKQLKPRNNIVVNWKFIFRACGNIMRACGPNPELPDFVLSLCLRTFYMNNAEHTTYNVHDFQTGERMLSERMDSWGYALNFTKLTKHCLRDYEGELTKWWVLVLNNPFQPLQTLKTMLGRWDEIVNETLSRTILNSEIRNLYAGVIHDRNGTHGNPIFSEGEVGARRQIMANLESPRSHKRGKRLPAVRKVPEWLENFVWFGKRNIPFQRDLSMGGLSAIFDDAHNNPNLNQQYAPWAIDLGTGNLEGPMGNGEFGEDNFEMDPIMFSPDAERYSPRFPEAVMPLVGGNGSGNLQGPAGSGELREGQFAIDPMVPPTDAEWYSPRLSGSMMPMIEHDEYMDSALQEAARNVWNSL